MCNSTQIYCGGLRAGFWILAGVAYWCSRLAVGGLYGYELCMQIEALYIFWCKSGCVFFCNCCWCAFLLGFCGVLLIIRPILNKYTVAKLQKIILTCPYYGILCNCTAFLGCFSVLEILVCLRWIIFSLILP